MAFETWNGSVWVTVATGISPMCRVTGAMRAATSTASARPASRRGLIRLAATGLRRQGVVDGEEVEQSTLGGGGEPGPIAPAELPATVLALCANVERHAWGCQP